MFKTLELDDPEWVARLVALPADRRDIHFSPRMLAPYRAAYGWKACLGVTDNGKDYIIQPMLLTKDAQLRHAYNFGGPVGSAGADYCLGAEHRTNLAIWKREYGVRREYCTLNPFLVEEHQSCLLGATMQYHVKDVVWMDLTKPKIRGTTRRLANKAQGAGVAIHQVGTSALPIFHDMYCQTMERVEAKDHWSFTIGFFEALYRLAKATVLFAFVDGKPEAGCMLLHGYGGPAYYHFAGTYNNHPQMGVNHALVLAAAEYSSKVLNCAKLHLGGGVTPAANDGLLTFKAGFSDKRGPIYTYEDQALPAAA